MALLHANFFSETLLLNVSMDVVLPLEAARALAGSRDSGALALPVLWLLHGEGGDHTAWQRNTSIERYAEKLGVAVVMPAAETSFYANMEYGFRYFDFVSRELPAICRDFFPLSARREDNVIAGGWMGGYGALKIALSFPENYRAVACLSGGNFPAGPSPSPAVLSAMPAAQERVPLLSFGIGGAATIYDLPRLMGSPNDIFHLADRALSSEARAPAVFMACGRDDPFLENARRTRDYFAFLPGDPFALEWHEAEGGHTWEFLDGWIDEFLCRTFPARRT